MLKDSHGRSHTYLRISVTDRCNLRCRYCMPAGGIELVDRDLILHPEEIGQIAQIFADLGVRKIRLTGGEPLIRRGLDVILDYLTSIQPQPELAITSNGLLLEEWLDRLVASGVRRINVSLDTLKEERFAGITGVDAWRQARAGIQSALRHPGIEKVKLNVVVQRGINDDEIGDFARLTFDYPLDVRFIELMPGRLIPWRANELVTGEEILWQLRGLEESPFEFGQDNGPARMYRYPGAPGRVGFISSLSCPACAGCNRLRLTSQGVLLRCLFDAEGLNLRTALLEGQSVAEIKDRIATFLLGKRQFGIRPARRHIVEDYTPCLAAVGG